jgi:hypothetical protein
MINLVKIDVIVRSKQKSVLYHVNHCNIVLNRIVVAPFAQHRSNFHNSPPLSFKDYYQILNISRGSNRKEIKHAFYKLSKQFHPDVNNEEDAETKFKEIQEAYHVLGDERRKIEYDSSLDGGFYRSPSTDPSSMGRHATPGEHSFKRRTGPIYTGRTSAYDYQEHFKSHYGPQTQFKYRTPHFSYGKTYNQEELKSYWNKKEFSSTTEMQERKLFVYKSLYLLAFMLMAYNMLIFFKKREERLGMQAQNDQIRNKS